MKNTNTFTTEELRKEEARLIKLIDKLSGNKSFGRNMLGNAITTRNMIQDALRRRAIAENLPADSFFKA